MKKVAIQGTLGSYHDIAAVFGFVIALMGCYNGYKSKGGAQGVGEATTNAVVASSIIILIFNYIITGLIFTK